MENLTKRYYSISEVAQMFDVNISKLRFWEEQFPSLNPKRDKAGDRKYTPDDISHLEEIVHLIDVDGYTIEGAKKALEKHRRNKIESKKIIESLTRLKGFMIELRDSLEE